MHELIVDKLANYKVQDFLVVFNKDPKSGLPVVQCMVERSSDGALISIFGDADAPIGRRHEIIAYRMTPRTLINVKQKESKTIKDDGVVPIGFGWFKHFYRHWVVHQKLKEIKHKFAKTFGREDVCNHHYWHMRIAGKDLRLYQAIKATIIFHWLSDDFESDVDELITRFFKENPTLKRNEKKVRSSINMTTQRIEIEQRIVNGCWMFNINHLK